MSPSRKSSKGRTSNALHPKASRKVRQGGGFSISKIKKLEKRFGQRGLARILGITPRSLRRYKQGTRTPRFDVAFKIKRAEAKTRGPRKTKSVKKKRARAEKIVKEQPELRYFEKKDSFKYSDTDHLTIFDVNRSDVDELIGYLIDEGCGAAFFVVSGEPEKGARAFFSSEVMEITDFAESWKELLNSLWEQYVVRKLKNPRTDLVGIKYNAPSVIERP